MRILAIITFTAFSVSTLLLSGCNDEPDGSTPPAGRTAVLKINGSTTVNPVASEAAEALRAEKGMAIQIDTQGGSTGGISALGDGLVQIGMSSRHVSDKDRAKYPSMDFHQAHVGEDAVAMVVSKDVWEGGVKSLTKEQVQGIYEGSVGNWKALGGPDQRVVFFSREPGRGEWEVFGKWVYGDPKKVPAVNHPELGGNEEARSKVGSTRGAVTFLSSVWADGVKVYALGIIQADGVIVTPTPENIASHKYPMSRPLFLLTNGQPTGEAKEFIDFVLSPRGQELVRKHGYLGLADLNIK